MNKVLVFIGSPYSKPSVSRNVNRAAMEYDWLWQNLGDRVIPVSMVVSSSFQDTICPRDYDAWLDLCIDMMKKCDIYYALPGESSGMEKEMAICKSMGIPIVKGRSELEKYLEAHPELLDSDIARIRREVGEQLYDARRRGVDLARVGVGEAKKLVGAAIGEGARFLGRHAMDFATGGGRKDKPTEDDRR